MALYTIIFLDLLSAAAFASAMLFASRISDDVLDRGSRRLLIVTLGIYVFVGVSNVLEHGGITSRLDLYEDYVEILFLPLFLMFLASVVTSREIRRRLGSEKALRESEGKYRMLIENIPDVVWMSDEKGATTFVSPAVERVYGYTPGEIRGGGADLWFGRLHPEDRARVMECYEGLFAGEGSFDIEYRIRRKDSRWIWLHDRAITSFDRDGEVYAFGIFSDVTSLKEAEKSLRESEFRQRVLLSALPDMIFRLSREGVFLDFKSPRDTQPLVPPEEFLGKNVTDFFPGEIGGQSLLHIAEALRTGKLQVFEYSLREQGKLMEYEARLAVSGEDEVLAVVRDVTERKRAVEELKSAKENLERQYEELKKLDLMKDGLIRDVSHELKTPVAKNAMQLEILKPIIEKHSLTEEEARALLVMEESLRRQEDVIRNILDLSRLEEGGRPYRREPVQLDSLVKGIRDEYRYVTDRYGVDLVVNMPALLIQSDGGMLWHLFSNLVNNSIKFRKKSDFGKVVVSADLNEGKVIVRVEDDGIGLEEDEIVRAFDRFYQSTPSSGGSGVGLAICRMIAEGLGGGVTITSEGRGRGAVASVTLPVD
jgi:PAS domain S-box-containing protein